DWPPPPEDEEALYGEDEYPAEDPPYGDGHPEGDPDDDPGEDPGDDPDWDAWTKARPAIPHQAPAPEALPHPVEPTPLTPEEVRTITSWDRDLDALTGELLRARQSVTDVPLPASLTASQLLRLAADPDGFAQELVRPMPRPPQPAARRGTRFHAWVEARFEELRLPMLEPEDLPGSEAEIADERDLEVLKEAFERTPYAHRTPYRIEAPFQLTIAGRVVRGRIDAVYREGDGTSAAGDGPSAQGAGPTYEIVDWKTSRTRTADPLQLALYRLAWAEQQDVPLESVGAAFLYVRTGEVVRPGDLPDRAALERLLLEEPGADPRAGAADEPPDQHVRAGR
ncbi:PD-(D/E)XK nuclease family protein, partial [Streptomyces spongiae]